MRCSGSATARSATTTVGCAGSPPTWIPARREARSKGIRPGSCWARSRRGAPTSSMPSLPGASQSAAAGDRSDYVAALWHLVWAGLVTGDTFAAVRNRVAGGSHRRPSRPVSRSHRSRPRLPRLGRPGAGRQANPTTLRPLVAGPARQRTRLGSIGHRAVRPVGPVRRAHPRQRADRGPRGRLRHGVPGVEQPGGVRPMPARLLRRRARGGAVRPARGRSTGSVESSANPNRPRR